MAEAEITRYLTHLAVDGKVSASTQNQALSAILFLYRNVLNLELEFLDGVVRAKKPSRLPVVYHREEMERVLAQLQGGKWLMASLLYGCGLRLMECLRLRVKDLDFQYRQITVRDGKGEKDRITMLRLGRAAEASPPKVKASCHDGRKATARSICPTRSKRNIPMRIASGWQYVFRPRPVDPLSGKFGGITGRVDLAESGETSHKVTASPKADHAIRCATASQPTCWNPAMTFAPFRSFSATKM
jgi:site-specific recombinase XerC